MKKLPTLILVFCLISQAFAQVTQPETPGLKGSGQVFYLETFGWENPADPKGWTPPPGFYMSDPKDIGYNWHWYPNDSLVTTWITKEPPMRSTTAANGNLCLFLDRYNDGKTTRIDLDNSITFPPIDCSAHSSVIVSFETCFMVYIVNDLWRMLLEVSTDNWVHSAQYDVSFGVKHKDRPAIIPGKPGIFSANISEVAAGMANVQFRFTWRNTSLYFWQIDDFQLSEAWDNDLQMRFAQMEWNDGDNTTAMSPFFMIPKSQLAGGSLTNFKASAVNLGEFDQEEAFFSVDITKNNTSVFHKEGDKKDIAATIIDTTLITDSYTPVDFGHYKVSYEFKQKQTENTPLDNSKEVFFNITDSVYSHADDTAEEDFNWGIVAAGTATDENPNRGHLVGVVYPIFADCEVNSISAFIAGGRADGMISFRYTLFLVPTEGDDLTPIEHLRSDILDLDSTMLRTWITLPFDKDGELEFLYAGEKVYACVEYTNLHTDINSKRYENLKIGADHSFKVLDPIGVARGNNYAAWTTIGYPGDRNIMVRLNINDHSNINDGVDLTRSSASLGQNYPNPFSQNTEIYYELANDEYVSITVMDLTGRIVMDLHQGFQPSGKYNIQLDATDLDAGIYLYSLKAGAFTETKKMTISKQ